MKKFTGGPASSEAGTKTSALRSAPWMLGVALSLLASAALAKDKDDGASHHRTKKKHPESVTHPAAQAPSSGVSVMGDLGMLNYSGSGSMSGTDIGGAPPTVTQSQSLDHTTVAGGATVEITPAAITNACTTISGYAPDDDSIWSNQALQLCSLFLSIGAIDPGRATASFAGLNAIPAGTGTSFLKETWSIPIALGYRTPARTFGINVPGLSFDVHGGVDFDRFQAGFNLTEPGAGPGAPGTSATKTWWQADPAVGVGARYQLAGGWFTGVDSTWAFAHSHSVSAPSANFAPFESYTLATGSHTLTTVMLNLGKSF
jgi:hypothetical protein